MRAVVWLSAYVILKALYNLAFVKLWRQGHWCFPVSMVIASMQLAVMLDGRLPQRRATSGEVVRKGLRYAGAALVVAMLAGFVLAAVAEDPGSAQIKLVSLSRIGGALGAAMLAASLGGVFSQISGYLTDRMFVASAMLAIYVANTVMAANAVRAAEAAPEVRTIGGWVDVVEPRRIELLTFALRTRRSPS